MKIYLTMVAGFISCGGFFAGIGEIAGQEAEQISKPVSAETTQTKSGPADQASISAQSDPASDPAAASTDASKPAAGKPNADDEPDQSNREFDITFDDLKFEMEKDGDFERTMLTEKINGYHGGTVSIRGYIRPSFSQSGLTKFIFVRDNKECCFGPGAAIYDCVLVRLKKGLETDFTVRPVSIEGKFALKEYKGPDGKVWSIYRMTDARVK